jgi:hypothetical protein
MAQVENICSKSSSYVHSDGDPFVLDFGASLKRASGGSHAGGVEGLVT